MFKLVIQDDEGKTTVVPLIRDEITIGRKEGNTIRLTERNVSRRHARILRNNGEVQIEDLGSYNGIRVNNARIAERVSLRVSDQVQIGDYKLYLKAEGVEQVDDARTMPIERIDVLTPTGSTDVLTAVGTTPTMPMPAAVNVAQGTHPPAAPTSAAQLAGSSNRAMVAIADTDPAGRPVATAAAVAALTAPVGYGKLVVLSSNFAGKEFELSRPQMIIGRTDENDIVINHRSISRNHAKLVREPETGRYTISDLQSSNGVRVNGQDYGKVELRRGDVVDLGHVRLRFVEPGEDFLFSRDAVITDVPDVGGKKGLLVAIILGVVVLGGVGAFFALKGGNKPSESAVTTGSGTGASNDGSNGSDTQVVTNPPPVLDAAVVAEVTPDAAVTNAHPGDDIKVECLTLKTSKDWSKLLECADRLATSDQAAAKELHAKAVAENKAEAAKRNMEDSVKTKDFKRARAELDKIPSDSVYRNEAKNAFDSAAQDAMDDYRDRAQSLADSKKCDEMRRVVREADSKGVGDEAHKVSCKPEVVADNPPPPKLDCNKTPNDARCPKQGSGNTKPPDKDCDADALKAKGDEYLSNNQDMAALASFEASMKCKSDPSLLRMAYMAACRAKSWQKAKYYYSKVPPSQSTNITQICMRYGFDPTKP